MAKKSRKKPGSRKGSGRSVKGPQRAAKPKGKLDAFISHASEDKEAFVRPLADALVLLGARIWYDDFSLRIGDSLSRSIDKGLSTSRFGIAVISPHFLRKPWPEYELRGLVTRDVAEGRVILPVWHGVTHRQVRCFSPTLADKIALDTAGLSARDVAIKLLGEIRPDLYAKQPREELDRLASGPELRKLQDELDRTGAELEAAKEALSEYQCPHCGSALSVRVDVPNEYGSGLGETYECGYSCLDSSMERPCPTDPRFPKFKDYKLTYEHSSDEWTCHPVAKTDMAHRVFLWVGCADTKREAARQVRGHYDRAAGKPQRKHGLG